MYAESVTLNFKAVSRGRERGIVLDTQVYRSEFVRDLRENLGCDQRTFAEIVGVTSAAVSRWENGHSAPRNPRWEKLHDLKYEIKDAANPDRVLELLQVASTVCRDDSPLDLLVEGRLQAVLRDRLRDMDLFDSDPRAELF